MPENSEGSSRNPTSGRFEEMAPEPDSNESAYFNHTIETDKGVKPVEQVCPKCMTEFDYRLDASIDPVFDGDPPVELCILGGGESGLVEAIFVHKRPERA